MLGLYIKDSSLIAEGKKVAIPSIYERKNLPGDRLLIVKDDDGASIVGIVQIAPPHILSNKEFDDRYDEHLVCGGDRLRWWANKEPIYLYPVRSCKLFDEVIPIDFQAGTNTDVDVNAVSGKIVESIPVGEKKFICLLIAEK